MCTYLVEIYLFNSLAAQIRLNPFNLHVLSCSRPYRLNLEPQRLANDENEIRNTSMWRISSSGHLRLTSSRPGPYLGPSKSFASVPNEHRIITARFLASSCGGTPLRLHQSRAEKMAPHALVLRGRTAVPDQDLQQQGRSSPAARSGDGALPRFANRSPGPAQQRPLR